MATPRMKTRFMPLRSPSLPKLVWKDAMTTRYRVDIRISSAKLALRDCFIAGRAMFTMLASNGAMNEATDAMKSTIHRFEVVPVGQPRRAI